MAILAGKNSVITYTLFAVKVFFALMTLDRIKNNVFTEVALKLIKILRSISWSRLDVLQYILCRLLGLPKLHCHFLFGCASLLANGLIKWWLIKSHLIAIFVKKLWWILWNFLLMHLISIVVIAESLKCISDDLGKHRLFLITNMVFIIVNFKCKY